MGKKVGICTVYTGFNYGSALQAFATKQILSELGYCGEIIKLSGSIISGRDVRIKKIIVIGVKMICHPSTIKKTIKSYIGDKNKVMSEKTKQFFFDFYSVKLQPVSYKEKEIKSVSHRDDFMAFLCGSDQIWNSTTYYVDPFYYLSFAPNEKRIAFAPSFGRDYIPNYNRKSIKKYISDIPNLSVREESGQSLIKELIGESAEVLVDPTLVLSKELWLCHLPIDDFVCDYPYVLAYFLDEPSEKAKNYLKKVREKGLQIIALPYMRQGEWFDEVFDAGPIEFLQLLNNATVVCTDSFHGVAFSINFQKDFYVFERQYIGSANQSTRVISLLNKVGLMNRFDPSVIKDETIDFDKPMQILEMERQKSKSYLLAALKKLGE